MPFVHNLREEIAKRREAFRESAYTAPASEKSFYQWLVGQILIGSAAGTQSPDILVSRAIRIADRAITRIADRYYPEPEEPEEEEDDDDSDD